jgi:hypothetical protein
MTLLSPSDMGVALSGWQVLSCQRGSKQHVLVGVRLLNEYTPVLVSVWVVHKTMSTPQCPHIIT